MIWTTTAPETAARTATRTAQRTATETAGRTALRITARTVLRTTAPETAARTVLRTTVPETVPRTILRIAATEIITNQPYLNMKGHFPQNPENAFSYAARRKTTGIHNKMKGKRSARGRTFARFKPGKGTCCAQPEYNKENEDRRRRGMYETIPIQQLDEWLERGYTGRIIDLRDAGAFCCGHIYGAENYPFHELMQNPSVLTAQEPLLF